MARSDESRGSAARLEPAMFELQAEFCRTMGNSTRLMILYALREGERCVNDLCEMLEASQPSISQHLAMLRNLGMVQTRREGQFIYYRLADPSISSACDMIRSILQRNVQARSDLFAGGGLLGQDETDR